MVEVGLELRCGGGAGSFDRLHCTPSRMLATHKVSGVVILKITPAGKEIEISKSE